MKPIKSPILHRFIEKEERQPTHFELFLQEVPEVETEDIKEILGVEKMGALKRLEKNLIKAADGEDVEVNLDGKRILIQRLDKLTRQEVKYTNKPMKKICLPLSMLSAGDIEWITENYKEITEQTKELSKAAKELREAKDKGRKEALKKLSRVLDTYEEG